MPARAGETDIICIDGKAMRGTTQENGRNPDIVSAYSSNAGITLATEACKEKSNEITAVPILLYKIDVFGNIITADAMCMQKEIVDKIRRENGDFVIELKANQRSLRYGIEDRLKWHTPVQEFKEGPALEHGRIETRIYRTYDGLPLIEDSDKWGGTMTVIEFESLTVKKSTGAQTRERRLYVSSLSADTPASFFGSVIRRHWSIESMHWSLVRSIAISSRTGLNARQRELRAISTHFKESCMLSFPSGEANARNGRTRPKALLN